MKSTFTETATTAENEQVVVVGGTQGDLAVGSRNSQAESAMPIRCLHCMQHLAVKSGYSSDQNNT